MRLQGIFYPEWYSVPHLSIDCREVSTKKLTHPSHWFCSRPHREVRRRNSDEMGEVPGEPIRTQLQRSPGSRVRISIQLAIDPDRCYHSKKPFVVADQRCLVT
jgi:hypothetical protein